MKKVGVVVSVAAVILSAAMYWFMSTATSHASAARIALNRLAQLSTAQSHFQLADLDGNSVNDYWVADVRGLVNLCASDDPEFTSMDLSTARADASPRRPSEIAYRICPESEPTQPAGGYLFASLKYWEDESGKRIPYDPDGDGRNSSKFAFIAWPEKYEEGGKLVLIVVEGPRVYKKDPGRALRLSEIDTFPYDPEKAGWTRHR